MSEINLKDFEFEDFLLDNVALFDEVLRQLGEPPLLENENFTVWSSPGVLPNYLVLENAGEKANALPMLIWFEGEDLRIDIEGISETFEWAKKHIEEDRNSVVELIRNLLTGYVLIESRGGSRFVQIYDSNGFFVNAFSRNNWLHFFTGLYLFRYKNYRRLYLPMFSETK